MESNEKLVSVVMPTYNAERYIREAVESIINQTYSNWELIIVDDESSDLTRKIINEYADADTRIRLIEGRRNGIGGALNLGVEMAVGDYIARMDADDISLSLRLEKQVDYMEKHNDVGVCATQWKGYAFDKVMQENMCDTFTDQEIKAKLIFSNAIGHPTIMFRKRVFEDGWRYRENIIAEDYDLWTRMIPDVKFACLEDVLLYYRREDQNSSFLIDGDLLIREDRRIIKDCIARLFQIDVFSYKDEDFCGNGEFYLQVKGTYSYLIRQAELLDQIGRKNREMKVISYHALNKSIQKRWELLLDFIEITDDILKEKRALFLRNLDGMFSGTKSLQEYKRKLGEIYNYIKNILKSASKVVFYGMGKEGKEALKRFFDLQEKQITNCKVEALVDREVRSIFINSKDYVVYDPQCLEELKFDLIIISTRDYYMEIRKQLLDFGVNPKNLLSGNILRLVQ